ncbi:MAG: hypothetical protein KKH72_02520 [Alphaproteobacteria bacterium]|nr:hypothetical protein [Alphaproteobacteria bacterium]
MSILASCLALVALPHWGLAADYEDALRGGYDWNDTTQYDDTIGFEAGLRYIYSLGQHKYSVNGATATIDDTSHILEGHLRINDYSTNTFLRGTGGYGIAINGTYAGGAGSFNSGNIAYTVFDLGQFWLGGEDEGYGVGGFVGYQYLADNPDVGRASFTTATSATDVSWSTASTYWTVPYDSEPNAVDIHALRLGASLKADLGSMADVSLDLAAIPYANISGTLGSWGTASYVSGGATHIQSSATTLEGWGYGAAADLMFGLKPVDNVAVRIGGRAQYLQGTYNAIHSIASITNQTDTDAPPDGVYDTPPTFSNQNVIWTDNPFSMWRLGAVLELSVAF